MWLIALGFGFTTLLLAWLLFGYIIWLRFVGDESQLGKAPPATSFPRISIVVPCLNEADLACDKARNLTGNGYPADRFEVVFADGGPPDGTLASLRAFAASDSRVRVVDCPVAWQTH